MIEIITLHNLQYYACPNCKSSVKLKSKQCDGCQREIQWVPNPRIRTVQIDACIACGCCRHSGQWSWCSGSYCDHPKAQCMDLPDYSTAEFKGWKHDIHPRCPLPVKTVG